MADSFSQTGKGDDVFAEHIRLRFTGRQKNLVMAGFQGAQQRLAGKIKRCANLAGFQYIADAVLKPGAIPVQLIVERLLKENLLQLFDGFVTEKILFRFATPAFVAVSDVRIKVCLVAGLTVAVDPRQSFNLASQQVNFLEVTAGFLRFDDELGQPRFQAHFDTADGGKQASDDARLNDVHEAVTAVAEHVQEKLSATEQRLAEMETAFSALKQEVTDRADETSQAFTRLKNSLDHTESLTQQRRSKATGGGGDALMTNC